MISEQKTVKKFVSVFIQMKSEAKKMILCVFLARSLNA